MSGPVGSRAARYPPGRQRLVHAVQRHGPTGLQHPWQHDPDVRVSVGPTRHHWTVDHVEYAETELVRSNELTGSMVVSHQQRLVCSHAVARRDDGTLNKDTECGMRAYFSPEEAEPRLWEQTNLLMRCQVCVETAGGWLVNAVTGERLMP
jgi:hypothetical protein